MWFGSEALGIANFRYEDDPMINVYSEDIQIGGYLFVATTLEICGMDNNITFYEQYLAKYECYTSNGVMASGSSAIGVQAIRFELQPFRELIYIQPVVYL